MKLTTSFDSQLKLNLTNRNGRITLTKTELSPWSSELEEKELGFFQLDKNSKLELVLTGELKINNMLNVLPEVKDDIPF